MMVNFGFIFGFLLGIPVAVLTEVVFHAWWLLPICGVIVGYVTNLLGIWMIFEPLEPTKWGPFKMHGLFLRRQREVADVYSKIIADDIVTLSNLGEEMMEGPSADRTRQLIETAMRPAVDNAAGVLRPALRVAIGTREYDSIRRSVANETRDYAMTPLADPDFSKQQSEPVRKLIADRMRDMPYADFSEMLRTAMREDEWLLYLHGAVEQLRHEENGSLIRAAPGLVRIGLSAWWRTTEWTLETSFRVGSRVVEAAISGESTTELLRSAGSDARDYFRGLLGLSETPPSRPAPGGARRRAAEEVRRRGL
jgi:hypothetical protein